MPLTPVRFSQVTISLLRGVRLCRWEYVHRNIKVIRSIGRGAYGEVKLAELNRRSGEPVTVAAKTVNNDDNMTPKKIKEMLKEARIMRGLRHPNIVSFIGVVLIDHPIYIILEYMKAGALDAYLRKNNAKVTTDERIRFCMGVAWGMEYLHSVSILHRDLATRNCLYDGSFYVKIADFGLSRKGTVYKMRVIQKMPIRYMAPESLLEYTFSQKTDVYTFGIVIYEIFTSREPYPDIPSNQIKATIVSGKLNSLPNTVPQDLTTLVVEKMWAKDPAQRTDFTTIVQFLEKTSGLKLPKSAFDDLPTLDLDKSKARNTRRLKSKAVERVSKVVETVKGPMEAIIEEGENIKKLTNT
ncbi:hypothetical protein Q1695_003323 [Nippostrongylus brasiliensis]|nr:hypothetical protein Q1695_003323 [Nippostrongylus brasiliensis]